jgi:dihydrofolate reductase
LLLGRRTYEGFAAAWPKYEGELADKYNGMPKYVISRTLTDDLVDEFHLMTFPVLLGTGRRLFGETSDKTTWKPTESITVGEGVLITIFQRAR